MLVSARNQRVKIGHAFGYDACRFAGCGFDAYVSVFTVRSAIPDQISDFQQFALSVGQDREWRRRCGQ